MKLETIIRAELSTWPYIHPVMLTDTSVNFFGADSELLFSRNLRNTPNWIYKEKPITYNFNKQSLRMAKDLDNVNDDYIYFSGTSFCMGVGLNESDRFSELVSTALNLDLINHSAPTFSIKAQFISFANFLNTNYKLPKVLVVEYPPVTAHTFYSKDQFLYYYRSKETPNSPHHTNAYQELLNTDYFLTEANQYRTNFMGICKRLNIKYCEISFHKDEEFAKHLPIVDIETNKEDINFCFARDLRISDGHYSGHPGIGIHKLASDIILKQL